MFSLNNIPSNTTAMITTTHEIPVSYNIKYYISLRITQFTLITSQYQKIAW